MNSALPKNSVGARYGQIQIEDLTNEEELLPWVGKLREASTELVIYRWLPAEELHEQLPDDFCFRMLCSTGTDDVRRFYPLNGFAGLIADGFAGGLAIMDHLHDMGDERRSSYRAMYQFFSKVRGLREHYGRNFAGIKDLEVRPTGRGGSDTQDVLPSDLGITTEGTGERWAVTQLVNEGRRLATDLSYERPSRQQAIELGLFAAAQRNPIRIDDAKQVAGLIRLALYDGPPLVECNEDVREWVVEQILTAIKEHLDDTQPEFDDWFSGPKNSFIKQIAKKKCPHDGVNNNVVRRVLFDLGWKSYEYVAGCLHALMRCFQNAIPKSLNEQEREIFEMVYLPQEHFGGLPLVLLQERIPFLKAPMIATLQGSVDFDLVGVLHQLLSYYSQMADSRRIADREARKYSNASKALGRDLQIFEYDDQRPVEDSGNRRRSAEIARDRRRHDGSDDDWDD